MNENPWRCTRSEWRPTLPCLAASVVAVMLVCSEARAQELVAAVLPASRSVNVGSPATVFATVINLGTAPATGCTIAVTNPIAASFGYFTTDPGTNAITSPASPSVSIEAGKAQTFLLALTPTAPFAPTDVQLRFDCENTSPAPVISGLNTVLLAASATPVPDVIALSLTPSGDGIVTLNSTGVFSAATTNVGAAGTIVASVVPSAGSLPLTLTLWWDPLESTCRHASLSIL